jgi:hypothetical protein
MQRELVRQPEYDEQQITHPRKTTMGITFVLQNPKKTATFASKDQGMG